MEKLIILILLILSLIIFLMFKISNKAKSVIINVMNVFFITAILMYYSIIFLELPSNLFDIENILFMIISLVVATVIYVFLYKKRDFIFEFVSKKIFLPIIVMLCIILLTPNLNLTYKYAVVMLFNYINNIIKCFIIFFGIVGISLILWIILNAISNKRKLNKFEYVINYFCESLVYCAIFWSIVGLIYSSTKKYSFLIVFVGYIIYKKYIEKGGFYEKIK